jgi:hypothetical protein
MRPQCRKRLEGEMAEPGREMQTVKPHFWKTAEINLGTHTGRRIQLRKRAKIFVQRSLDARAGHYGLLASPLPAQLPFSSG